MRRAIACSALIALGLLALQQASMAVALDIPAAVPAQFRSLIRARMHMPKPRQAFESRFEIKAGKGYELTVIGQGDVVAVEVARPARHKSPLERLLGLEQAATNYVARGTVTPRRIAASFGKFGRVDVRFRPSGRVVSSDRRRRCRGADRFTNRLGVFVGSIRFSGEKHYVAVRAHRAKGRVHSPLRLHCALPPIRRPAQASARPLPQHPSFTPAILTAAWRHAVAATELFVLRGRRATLFLAFSEESLGSSLAEFRYGLATARSKAFHFNDALTAATIAPPPPFHGKGIYGAAPDGGTSWTGPLSVSVPGAPRAPLTGPQFKVELSAGY
jgi:hypothetical protein